LKLDSGLDIVITVVKFLPKLKLSTRLKVIISLILTLLVGLGGGYLITTKTSLLGQTETEVVQSENQYVNFTQEIYQTIQDNYWKKLSDKDLTKLFVLAAERISGHQFGANIESFEDFKPKLEKVLADYQTDQEKTDFVAQLADVVLANLKPQGRSRLYTKQKKQELKQKVANINPEADHYQELGVDKNADQQKIKKAYQTKKQNLEQQASPSAKQELEELDQAYKTLADQKNRQRYDQAGVNPTMDWQLITPEIFYLHIKKFSPTTIQELQEVTKKVDQGEKLDTLILDLRNNVGGAIDGLPYFLGPFIGPNQYAYQFIQQGNVTDYKTKTGWLPSLERYKKVVILINGQTQSSAEVMASVLKKYNVGVLVGTPSKGWGTIEKVFPLDNQLNDEEEYSIFLVHHLTLKANGQPIESNGVEPAININQPDWQQQLSTYFDDQNLIQVVGEQFQK
jgi:C-terminal processing protease CtpA/Prc